MDQPSQQYPPWLTPVPSVVTDAAGSPVATLTGVSYIPPTYYGPSIPLGTLYSYGGYTFPPTVVWPGSQITSPTTVIPTEVSSATTMTTIAPISTGISTPATFPTAATMSTTIPITTILTTSGISIMSSTISGVSPSSSIITTATPSIPLSTSITSTISTPSTTPSTLSTVSAISSSSSSGAPVPSVSPSGISQATGLTKGQLVGIVVASVLGLIFLFVLSLFLYLWFKALKNRRQYATLSPIDDDYVVVPPGGRLPGEGSPRQSGEEHDAFLRPRDTVGAAASPSRPRGAQATANSNSSASSNSHASGFGVLLDRPSIGFTPSIPEELQIGQSPSELEHLEHKPSLPEETEYDDGGYTGAFAYSKSLPSRPQLDPAAAPLLGSADLPSRRSQSSLPGEPEEATVHTARRVKVEDLGPRELADPSSSRKLSNGILSAIGLGGLAHLARQSWFKHFDSPRQSGVLAHEIEPLSEKDVEAGHAPERPVDSFGIRTRGPVAESQEGARPVSRVSARSGTSGASQYHDAQSSLQGGASSLTPPPRALTPVDQPTMTEQTLASSPLAGPPIYEDRPPAPSTPPRNDSTASFEFPAGVDVLDMPAPTALSHFASISSLKESNSGSSFAINLSIPPPDLETIRPVGCANSLTESGLRGSGFVRGRHIPGAGDLDILEEAPPEAENGWRSIADSNRRGTFGTYVQGHDFASEQASLHSMRSHFSPSMWSTGSAPIGRFEMCSVNSITSRPSAHSRSASSGLHSLVHQGSISSDNRRRNGSAGHSPALSAFGMRPTSRASPGLDQSFDSTVIGTPPTVHVSPQKSTTLFDISTRTLRGLPTPPVSNSSSPIITNLQLNPLPWAGGLAHDWQPAP